MLPIGRTFVRVVPELGYSLQTRLLDQIQGNIAYRRSGANVSTIISEVAYSQNNLDYHWNIRTLTKDDDSPATIANYQEGV